MSTDPVSLHPSPSSTGRASARTWTGLAVLLLPALLVAMDISILFIAGPAIAADLAPTASQWLWMMDIYSFVMAGLLLTMGNVGDRIGRRRLLLIGATVFGLGSACLALAPSAEVFIAARVLLGIGAATLAPSTLALIRSMFHDPDQRRIAVGAWTAAFAGGAVAGPVIGGLLLEHLWWGSVFLINVPVMVVLLAAAPLLVPESRDPASRGFDLPGAVLSLAGIISVVYAGKRFAEYGPDGTAFVALAAGAALSASAVMWMRRSRHPLIDLSLFTRPAFSAAVGTNTAAGFAMAGLGLLAFTFLQAVHDLSPLRAALTALPTVIGTVLGASFAAKSGSRVRPAPLVVTGFLISAAGLVVVGRVTPDGHVAMFIAGYTVLTFGIGMLGTLANSLVLETAPPGRASTAAATSETGMVLGEAFGIAIFGTVSSALYQRLMAGEEALTGLPPEAGETVAGDIALAERLPTGEAVVLIQAAREAFTSGVTTVALAAAALFSLTAIAMGLALRHAPRTERTPNGA